MSRLLPGFTIYIHHRLDVERQFPFASAIGKDWWNRID